MNAPQDLLPRVAPRPVPAAMLAALKDRFGDRCSMAQAVREQHGRDESPFPVTPPEVVVFCQSTDEVAADSQTPGGVNPIAVTYLNRLSDLLFICSRAANGTADEILWIPGGDRDKGSSE